ncbi:hypothetical protein QTI66_04440 [Variovorax sp. J22R133]|uniref:hypothetical protein n=1 Tax=Variovorax brevis TaxID=3053503 RepID=UPI002576DCBB|nr:hypothetical protein [Variovorax sp. J22R133]MDM0111384.1 hypothetical protein [Variovorax sp. J22R133]
MSNSSILGGEHAPTYPGGTDIDALGPSDSSDSGSDVQSDRNRSALPDDGAQGALPISHDSSSDAAGTGERASAQADAPASDADVMPDRIGIVPRDAMDAAVSIDDPAAAAVHELAASGVDDDEAGEDDAF